MIDRKRSHAGREAVTAVLLDLERRGLARRNGNLDRQGYPAFDLLSMEAVTEFSKHSIWDADKADYTDAELDILGQTRKGK